MAAQLKGPADRPRPDSDSSYWGRVGQTWTDSERDRLWRAHSDAVNRRLLEDWLPARQPGRALKTDLFDEAFGRGLLDLVADRYDRIVGIDVAPGVIHEARGRAPRHLVVLCDVRALPFRDRGFEAVASISTLDHFSSPADIPVSLRELHRVLAPGGLLVLTLDNRANPIVALRNLLPFRLVHALRLVPYYVGRTVGPWRARRLLIDGGFGHVETRTVMHCPRVAAVPVARMLDRRAGDGGRARFLRLLLAFERLGEWPTRWWTGHFVALRARARPGGSTAPGDAGAPGGATA